MKGFWQVIIVLAVAGFAEPVLAQVTCPQWLVHSV